MCYMSAIHRDMAIIDRVIFQLGKKSKRNSASCGSLSQAYDTFELNFIMLWLFIYFLNPPINYKEDDAWIAYINTNILVGFLTPKRRNLTYFHLFINSYSLLWDNIKFWLSDHYGFEYFWSKRVPSFHCHCLFVGNEWRGQNRSGRRLRRLAFRR